MNLVSFYVQLLTDNNRLNGWTMKEAVLPSNPINSIVATQYGLNGKGRILESGLDHYSRMVQLAFRGESSDIVLKKAHEINEWCLTNIMPKFNLVTVVNGESVKWRSYAHLSGPMFITREKHHNLDVYTMNCEIYADLLP